MSEVSVKPADDDVLRKIGRNVVNFQKLEHALRKLIPLANASGSLTDLPSSSRRQAKSLRKKALGEVVERFNGAFYGDSATPESNVAPDEARLSFSIKLEDGAGSEAQRRELAALVVERNRLVHHDLFEFDFSSESDCPKLAARLDAHRGLRYVVLASDLSSAVAENSGPTLAHNGCLGDREVAPTGRLLTGRGSRR